MLLAANETSAGSKSSWRNGTRTMAPMSTSRSLRTTLWWLCRVSVPPCFQSSHVESPSQAPAPLRRFSHSSSGRCHCPSSSLVNQHTCATMASTFMSQEEATRARMDSRRVQSANLVRPRLSCAQMGGMRRDLPYNAAGSATSTIFCFTVAACYRYGHRCIASGRCW